MPAKAHELVPIKKEERVYFKKIYKAKENSCIVEASYYFHGNMESCNERIHVLLKLLIIFTEIWNHARYSF